MPIRITWENKEKTRLHARLDGHVTIADYEDALDTIIMLLESVPHLVDIIYSRSPNSHGQNLAFIPYLRYGVTIMPKNCRLHIFINPSPQTEAVLMAMKRYLAPHKLANLRVVKTFEEVDQLLQQPALV